MALGELENYKIEHSCEYLQLAVLQHFLLYLKQTLVLVNTCVAAKLDFGLDGTAIKRSHTLEFNFGERWQEIV